MESKHTLTPYDNVRSAQRELVELMETTLSAHCHILIQFLFVQDILRTAIEQLEETKQA